MLLSKYTKSAYFRAFLSASRPALQGAANSVLCTYLLSASEGGRVRGTEIGTLCKAPTDEGAPKEGEAPPLEEVDASFGGAGIMYVRYNL